MLFVWLVPSSLSVIFCANISVLFLTSVLAMYVQVKACWLLIVVVMSVLQVSVSLLFFTSAITAFQVF